jgi:diguanylate cyclase (GGDEF)-like protein
MMHRGACIGVLDFFRTRLDAFGDDEVRFLESIASQAAMAISNARLHERTVALSLTDPLTGLHNRRSLLQRLELELERSERFGHAFSVAFVDVDRFRELGEAHGHLAGEAVLRRVGEILSGAVRKADAVARWGGEEFALLLPRADRAAARELGEKLRALVRANPFAAAQPLGHVTVSVGIATYPEDAREIPSLVDCADAALFAAKKRGRDAVVPYAAGMRENPQRRRDVRVTAAVEPGAGS